MKYILKLIVLLKKIQAIQNRNEIMTNEEALTLVKRQRNSKNLVAPFQASGNCVYSVLAAEDPPTDAFTWKRQEKVDISGGFTIKFINRIKRISNPLFQKKYFFFENERAAIVQYVGDSTTAKPSKEPHGNSKKRRIFYTCSKKKKQLHFFFFFV